MKNKNIIIIVLMLLIIASFVGLKLVTLNKSPYFKIENNNISIDQTNKKELLTKFSQYQNYTQKRFKELEGSQSFAIFFHADWCPQCKKLEEDIETELENGQLQNALILKADYDNQIELRKEYEVVFQTSVIFFNKDGEIDKKVIGANIENIKEYFE